VYYAKDRYSFVDANKNVNYGKYYLSETVKNRWKGYSDSVEIYEIQGEHSTMFDPAFGGKELARLIQGQLDSSTKEP
jgi:thioesterase domain-containing protein